MNVASKTNNMDEVSEWNEQTQVSDDETGYESERSEVSDDDEYEINTSTNKKPANNFKTSNKKQRSTINDNYNGITKKA